VPIIGAVSGATINVIFMEHFQRIAKGHFTLRRLERIYGSAHIRHHYTQLAAAPASSLPSPDLRRGKAASSDGR